MSTLAGVAPVDLSDSRSYVEGVPHAYLAHLRRHDPVHWQDEPGGPGFWAVTKYADCVTVNRDWERFSSAAQGTMPFELGEEEVAQQSLMMLNMDPPLHTRYRRLVNKGFTPRMVRDLEESIHRSTDAIIDDVIEKGEADFVTQISAELPLQVIAELLGVPQEDRHKMFEWSNHMVGNADPEYQAEADLALYFRHGALRLRRRALRQEAHRPARRPHERTDQRRGRGRAAERPGARALLPHAHGGRQRDDAQPDVGRHARLLRVTPSSGSACSKTAASCPGPWRRCCVSSHPS